MAKYSREEQYTRPKDIKGLLTIVLEKEKASFGFYEDMLKHPFAQTIRELINELKMAEAMHIKIIEKKLAEIEQPFLSNP